jgi:PST family polysaccharide transporter
MSDAPERLARPADRLRHSLLSQAGSQGFRLLVAIGIGGWLARYLGPTALGQLSYAAAVVGVFGPLGGLGVKGSLAVLLCESDPLPGLVSTAFCLELLGTAVMSLCLLPWVVLADDPVIPGLIALGVIANFFNSCEVFEADFLSQQRGTVVARVGFLKALAGAVVMISALVMKAPLIVFGGVQAVQNAIAAFLFTWLSFGQQWQKLVAGVTREAAVVLLRKGLPLLVSGLSIMLYMKSDLIVLEWLGGSSDVGQYSVAVRIVESLYFLPLILVDTFLPRISDDHGFLADAELSRLYRLAWLLGVALMFCSMLVLPLCVPLVFGSQYEPAQSVLFFLGPAAFAVSVGCANGAWLNSKGYLGVIVQRSAFGAILNIGLNILLIPSAGIKGAAIATSLSQVLSVYLLPLLRAETRSNTLKLMNPWS